MSDNHNNHNTSGKGNVDNSIECSNNGNDRKNEEPIVVKILKIEDEAKNIKTFHLDIKLESKPGQFVMLWIPGLNEKPFSIYESENVLKLTVAKVGEFTEKLFSYKVGDKIGVRGPYGKPFSIAGKHIALVGGGYGSAPLTFLAKEALKQGIKSELIIGARNKELLLYMDKEYPDEIKRHYCTDDGSYGFKGFTTERLKEILKEKKIDTIYTVGPELMMKKIVDISDEYNAGCQISLERYMKCGFGVCAVCCVDPLGLRMCVEGPCIDKQTAKQITEFGKYHRDAAGKKIKF